VKVEASALAPSPDLRRGEEKGPLWLQQSAVRQTWALIGVLVLAWVLRLMRLDFQPLWWDEGYSVYQVVVGLAEMIENTARDFHPPLYYLLLSAWSVVSGLSPYVLRFLSACFGTLAVPVVWAIGRRCFGVGEGVLAALLVALLPFCVHHAQEARMYALLMLLATISTYALLKILALRCREGDGILRVSILYQIATLGALYTHYAAWLLLGAQIAVVILSRRGRARLGWWVARWAVLGLIFLPWGIYALSGVSANLADRQRAGGLGLLDFTWRLLQVMVGGYAAWDSVPGQLATCIVILLVVLGLGLNGRRRGWALLVLLALPLGALWVANRSLYYEAFERIPRLLIYTVPLLALLAARGMVGLARRRLLPLASVALVVLLIGLGSALAGYYTTVRRGEDDFRPLVARLRELSGPADGLVADFDWQIGFLRSYLPEGGPGRYYLAPADEWVRDPACMASDLDVWLDRHGRLWYPAYQALGGTRGRNIEGYLTRRGYLALDEWYGVTRLLLFGAPPDSREGPSLRPSVRMGEGSVHIGESILLTGAVLPGEARPEEVLPVALYWMARSVPTERYTVFLHLVDRQGRLIAQRDAEPRVGPTDGWPVGVSMVGHHGILLPQDIAPGMYALYLGMTRLNGDRLPVSGPGADRDRVLLGMLEVR